MTSWQTKTIGELVDYEQPSKYLVKDTNYIEDGIPVLTANKAFILGYTHETEGIYVASKDNPVIIFDDFTTDNKFVDFDFKVKSSAIKILTAKPSKVLPRFVHGAMRLIKTGITEHKRRFISEYQFHPIDMPELAEQERIVGVLEVWDEYIEKLEQKIALKEQLKKGLMQQFLIGKRRLPGFSKEWKAFKMNELGNTYSGLTGKTKDDFGSGEPFITYMNIYSNPVLNTKNMQLVHIGENERQSIAEYGDIFFTTSSETPDEVGISSVLLDKSDQNIYLNSFCFGFRMHSLGTLEPRFAAYYFRSSIFRKKMTRIAQGASRYNLSKKYFMETEIRVPELDEQLAIVVLLENIDKQIAVH